MVVKKKRSHPPTTGEFINKATAQERLNAANRERSVIEADRLMLSLVRGTMLGEPDMDADDWTHEGIQLAAGVNEAPTVVLAKELWRRSR